MTRPVSELDKVASEHADWFTKTLSPVIRLTYFNAFKHGYKHGKEDSIDESKSDEDTTRP